MGDLPTYARRFVRQLGASARMDFLLVMGSKAQVALWMVTDFVAYTSGIAAVLLLAERLGGVIGWTVGELSFLFGFSTLSGALRQVFFGYNLAAISRRVGRGQLDHTLIQPQPLVLSFLTEGFSPLSMVGALAPGVVLLALGIDANEIAVTPAFVGKLMVSLVASMTVVLSASFAVGAAAFWAPRGAEEISTRADSMLQLTDFPLDPLPAALRSVLLTAIPAGFVAWFPVSALLGRRPPGDWIFVPLAALLAALGAALVFRKGLRRYARTGSSRYSDLGHRR